MRAWFPIRSSTFLYGVTFNNFFPVTLIIIFINFKVTIQLPFVSLFSLFTLY